MMYVPVKFRVSKDELEYELKTISGSNLATVDTLVMIDYYYHHDDPDYDGGLSFIDRINKKFYNIYLPWVVEELKESIRNSEDKCEKYMKIVRNMMPTNDDIFHYGL